MAPMRLSLIYLCGVLIPLASFFFPPSQGDTGAEQSAMIGRVGELEKELDVDLPLGPGDKPSPARRTGMPESAAEQPKTQSAVLFSEETSNGTSLWDRREGSALPSRKWCQHPHEIFQGLMPEDMLRPPSPFTTLQTWDAKGDRFLFLYCALGQASNRLMCVNRHILFAALMNRTLVIDTTHLDWAWKYNWTLLINVQHLRDCFGPHTVITTDEYRQSHGGEILTVDAAVCWTWLCRIPWPHYEGAVLPPNFTLALRGNTWSDFERHYLTRYRDMRTIAVGDLFSGNVGWVYQMHGFAALPLRFLQTAQCTNHNSIVPDPVLVRAAEQEVQRMFQGRRFVGVHWRGGDFARNCQIHPDACRSPDEAGKFIARVGAGTGISDVLLCSNMHPHWIIELMKALTSKHSMRVVQGPELPPDIQSSHFGAVGEGRAAFQKLLLSLSSVFLGTNMSTFSLDVERMRIGFNTFNCEDKWLFHSN